MVMMKTTTEKFDCCGLKCIPPPPPWNMQLGISTTIMVIWDNCQFYQTFIGWKICFGYASILDLREDLPKKECILLILSQNKHIVQSCWERYMIHTIQLASLCPHIIMIIFPLLLTLPPPPDHHVGGVSLLLLDQLLKGEIEESKKSNKQRVVFAQCWGLNTAVHMVSLRLSWVPPGRGNWVATNQGWFAKLSTFSHRPKSQSHIE